MYVYDTKDALGDQVILLKKGATLVSIEVPLYKNNVNELNEFINGLGAKETYVLLVDHVNTKDYLPDAKLVTAIYAVEELTSGQPVGLFNNFVAGFGADNIQNEIRTDFVTLEDKVNLNGIELRFAPKGGEFDVYIPKFNAVYTHMLGHDVHSIIMGKSHAEIVVNELKGFINDGIKLILTSHYVPETIDDVKTKIAYINRLVEISETGSTKDEFINKVKEEFSSYGGLNYLEMSAGGFFTK